MKKNITLDVITKIDLLTNLNNSFITSKNKIYDLNNFEKNYLKSNEYDIYYHTILYLIILKEKNMLNRCDSKLDDNIINELKAINAHLEKIKLEYILEKRYEEGVVDNMKNNIEIREIKDFSNSGIYYIDEKGERKIVSSEGLKEEKICVYEKINLLENIADNILSNHFNELMKDSYDKIFNIVFDLENASLEQDINRLYHDLMMCYYRPIKDMKKIERIKSCLVKCTFIEKNSDSKVKYLINERVCYI